MHLASETEQWLQRLVSIFLEENDKVNLSAFRTPEQCWTGNVLDSLAATMVIADLVTRNPKLRVLDLGTGGGFPLLPLAMLFPDSSFAGLDATKKKTDAIGRIVKEMDIKNVTLIADRAETLGKHAQHREKYDVVTARAVAEITVLLEYASPFTKPGGKIVLWKSMGIDDELKASLNAQKELQCRLIDTYVYELPGDFGKRQLLVFEKTGKLSNTYPRAVGIPKKKPL